MKKCITCKVEKEFSEFDKHKGRKDGLLGQCRGCKKEYWKQYYQDNKERKNERAKQYFQDNKEKIKEYRQANKEKRKEIDEKYRQANREEINKRAKEYRQANKEKVKEYNKKWWQTNKERIRECQKEYRKANQKKINEYQKNRRVTHPLFKLSAYLRNRTSIAFKRKGYSKNTKTQDMLGVSWEIVKAHIERQFTKGMNWDNYGEWHIDHIIPLASANNEKELLKLCHYSNLQPLWAEDNLIKKDKITNSQVKLRI